MYCYNPTSRYDEDVPTPLNDARAIEMLSGHPDSDVFIEEHRRRRKTQGIEKAMIIKLAKQFDIQGVLFRPLESAGR